MKSPRRRFRLFTDWNIQGKIVIRIGIAWMACQFTMVATILGFLALEGADQIAGTAPSSPWRFLIPAIVASTAILPIALFDMLIFTNKFTGPLLRFRKHLQRFADGRKVSALHFRPGDLLTDLSSNFNEMQARSMEAKRADTTFDKTISEPLPQTMGVER